MTDVPIPEAECAARGSGGEGRRLSVRRTASGHPADGQVGSGHPTATVGYDALPGLVREYVGLYQPCETDPLALGLGTLAAVSTAVGRGAWADYCGRTLPMLWLAALGATGLARKEQIARAAERLLVGLDPVTILRDVSSGEALLEELEETPHALLLLREAALLTDRARSPETRLLRTKLLELYDMPDRAELRRVSRGRDDGRVIVSNPTLGLIATGTPSDLTPLDDLARSGLVNRLFVLPVRECPPVPRPAAPSDSAVAVVAKKIRARCAQASQQRAYPFSGEAARWWDDGKEGIYVALRRELRDLTEIERACIERRERHVVVLATLFAVLDGRPEIDLDHLERGQTIVREANERLLGLLGSVAAEEPPEVAARRAATVRGYVALVDAIRRAEKPLSQVALAALVNAPRVTLQRRLADLETAGLVRRTDDGYVPVGGAQVPTAHPSGGQAGSGHPPSKCSTAPAPSALTRKGAKP